MKSVFYFRGVEKTWEPEPFDKYEVTGVTRQGKRFKLRNLTWEHARGINLWRGTEWLRRNGRRYKIVET